MSTATQPLPVQAPIRSAEVSSGRQIAIDVFRGFVMTLMLAEVLHLSGLAQSFPGSPIAAFISFNTSHVDWAGCSLHDLIQPGFSFLVGAALPFSIAARRKQNQNFGQMLRHAAVRALILISLGIILRSLNKPQTYFTFEDTLTQIGLGYVFLFLLGFASVRVQIGALAALLIGYWAAFALYPVVPSPEWPAAYTGFAAHWNKNTNLAWAFDTWFLNLFPREQPFLYNAGGYATLSFIPTLGTMIIGLLAGEWLKSTRSTYEKLRGMAVTGVVLAAVALVLHMTGICPVVKRIWTPSWTLASGGLVLLLLSLFYWVTEIRGWRAWAFPLIVVGSNSIAAYLMSWTMEAGFIAALNRHFGPGFFGIFGPPFEPVFRGALVLLMFWLILFWMYRNKIFLRI